MRGTQKLALGVAAATLTLGILWSVLHKEELRGAAQIGGRLELAAGDVQVSRDGKPQASVSGVPLSDRAEVRTGKGARALIRLVGGASAFLGDATTITLMDTGLTLGEGRAWLDVPPLARPISHALGVATVTVSDAGISVARSAQRSEVYVARGLAVVSSSKARREVTAGERAIVNAQGDIQIEPVAFWDDWTGGMADRGLHAGVGGAAGRLYAIDRNAAHGTPARSLSIKRQNVHARIADGIAETSVDQTFFNAHDSAVEGYYWFTVPERALVTGFALETNGNLIEGEVVERKEAAAKYEASIQAANDPALLEWISDRTYRARIYPIAALGTRRIVLRYIEQLAMGEQQLRWVYPMAQAEADAVAIDEFSLHVDLGALGKTAKIATSADARVEEGGRFVTMRRSVYTPRSDFQIELTPKQAVKPLRVTRFDSGGDQADFVMLRWVPDLDWTQKQAVTADLVLAVDVSAGGDDADRQLKFAVTEAVLRNLAAGDRFALMTTDVSPRVIYPESGLALASAANVSQALERLSAQSAGGATDLGAMFDPGLSRLYAAEQPALVYIGDGQATSGELRGAEVVERLRRSLEGARARFFAVGVGADANHPLLERLSAVGGGSHFRVDDAELAVRQALRLTAQVKTPTITDLTLDVGVGLDEPLSNVSGKLARGEELILLARTHHELPSKVSIRGRLLGKTFSRELTVSPEQGSATALVPRLWAAEFARRLLGRAKSAEEARGKVVALALEYGLMTPFSSILALDSEEAYPQMGITRRRRAWDRLNVQLTALEPESKVGAALAIALSPVTLLTGCSSPESAAPVATKQSMEIARPSVGSVAAAPVTPPPPQDAPMEPAAPAQMDMPPAMDTREGKLAEEMGILTVRGGSGPARRVRQKLGTAFGDRDKSEEHSQGVRHAASSYYVAASTCSDVAARPLVERSVLWQRRLRSAQSMSEALALYDAARAACEIASQRDQRTFLALLEPHAREAQAAELLFTHFRHDPQAVSLLSRRMLRRTLDPYVAAVARREGQGGSLDWVRLDLELAALPNDEARVTRLRSLLLSAPTDVDAEMRLMKFLLRSGKREEALAMAMRLRERAPLSPLLLRDLGDVQREAGLREDALRTYSEIVEFDPESAQARSLVGDTLLSHGWYEVAYRQFRTLVELTPGNLASELRLALAAAGTGRTDEALRILRRVSENDRDASTDDPRLSARLLACALLSRLLADPASDAARIESVSRQLKQLQLFPTPGSLYVLTWEDLDVSLGLSSPQGDVLDAAEIGVLGLSSRGLDLQGLADSVQLRSEARPDAKVRYTLHELVYDGKTFSVKVLPGSLG